MVAGSCLQLAAGQIVLFIQILKNCFDEQLDLNRQSIQNQIDMNSDPSQE